MVNYYYYYYYIDSIQFMEDNIIETEQQLQYCTNNRLIPLIEDSVVLHTSHVLSSNHDNKLFKQQLFISKQDEVCISSSGCGISSGGCGITFYL